MSTTTLSFETLYEKIASGVSKTLDDNMYRENFRGKEALKLFAFKFMSFLPFMDLITKNNKENKQYAGIECYEVCPGVDSVVWKDYENHSIIRHAPYPDHVFSGLWKVIVLKDNDHSRVFLHIFFEMDEIMYPVTSNFMKYVGMDDFQKLFF